MEFVVAFFMFLIFAAALKTFLERSEHRHLTTTPALFRRKLQEAERPTYPSLERRLLQLINEERRLRHLPPLVWDPQVSQVARAYSYDLWRRSFFSHYSPEGDTCVNRLQLAGIPFKSAAENLVKGYSRIEDCHSALAKSPSHYKAIVGPFTHLGAGVVRDELGQLYITEIFISC